MFIIQCYIILCDIY